jgi:hypothetical protein
MMRYYIFAIFFSCFYANAKNIEIKAADQKNYGCNYDNADFSSNENANKKRVVDGEVVMNYIAEHEDELHNYLKQNVDIYHSFREWESSLHAKEYFVDKTYFSYQGNLFTIYVGGSNNSTETKFLGFCFEGNFDSHVVDSFFAKKEIEKIKMDGDGVFYLIDDFNGMVKLVKENGQIRRMYIYMGYD